MRTNTRTSGILSGKAKPYRTTVAAATIATEDSPRWTFVKVTKPITFQYCTDLKKFHNGSVRNCTVYCRKANVNAGGKQEYFLLYKRPKKYWVGHFLTAEEGKGHLETIRDSKTGTPVEVSVDAFRFELENIYQDIMSDRKKYDNLSHKR